MDPLEEMTIAPGENGNGDPDKWVPAGPGLPVGLGEVEWREMMARGGWLPATPGSVMPDAESIDAALGEVERHVDAGRAQRLSEDEVPEDDSLGIFDASGAVKVRPAPGTPAAASESAGTSHQDPELFVLTSVVNLLASLPADQRKRVERYLWDRFGR